MKNKHLFLSRQGIRSLLAICFFTLTSIAVYAQAKRINLQAKEMKVENIIQKLRKGNPEYRFLFNHEEIKNKGSKTIDLKDVSIEEALQTILSGTGLTYRIERNVIVIVPQQQKNAPQKKITIKGRVADTMGNPIMGATIVFFDKETTGCATDLDGNFSLEVPNESTVLLCSMVGMKQQEILVGKKRQFNIVLEEDTQMMEDVVVTGYQTLSSERSAGSFGIVKGNVISDKVGLTGNLLQSMEGLTTGLSVNMSEGADKYTVRGITSINSNRSPLFVVDGMPLENSQVEALLNGNDVESITLLKDATAASIWGSQAANGVVVITTKKGSNNEKVKISYNGSFAYTGMPDYGYLNMMDNEMFMRNAQEMFDQYASVYPYDQVQTGINGLAGSHHPIILPHERLMYQCYTGEITTNERDAGLKKLMSQNGRKDYEKNFMSDKLMTRHTISLSGGNQKSAYYLSVGYVGNQGNNKDWNDRFTINAKEDFTLTDWLKWDITVNASYGNSKGYLSPWSDYANDNILILNTNYTGIPYATFYDAQGNAVDWSVYTISDEKRASIEQLTGTDMSFYPVDDFNRSSNKTIETNLRVNTGLTFDLLKGLRYESRFQYSRFHSKTEKYYPEENWKIREEVLASTPANTLKPWLPTSGGNFILQNGVITDYTFRNQLSYNGEFNDGLHQITALAGIEIREYKNTMFNNFLRGYDMQTMQYTPYDEFNLNRVSNALLGSSVNTFNKTHYTQSEVMRRYFSLYSNVAYTFLKKYSLNASLRIDQSNLFGSDPNNQYKPIWAIGGAWKISEEGFMKDIHWLDRLSLRATYGFAGNSPQPGQGGKYDILTATSSSFFETNGFSISTPANDKITWEKTRTWNVGFDADVLGNRLNVSFDYYDKKTTDLISNMLLNPMSGWLSTIGNVGTMTNKGFELTVNSHNLKYKGINWYTTLTLSHNKNEITKLDVETPHTAQTLATLSSVNVEGYPINALFSYRYAGLNEKGEPQAYNQKGEIVSGTDSHSLSKEDVVYSGTTVPKFFGGLTNRFTYKNWELSFMFVYNFGNKMRNECETFNYGRLTSNLSKDFDNRWRKAGDEAHTNIPGWQATKNATANYNLFYMGDQNVLDASYIKLRDLSVAYNVPTTFCKKLHTESMRVNLQLGNLFYWAANDKDIDPEYYQLDAYTGARQEKFGPTYSIELNINF